MLENKYVQLNLLCYTASICALIDHNNQHSNIAFECEFSKHFSQITVIEYVRIDKLGKDEPLSLCCLNVVPQSAMFFKH